MGINSLNILPDFFITTLAVFLIMGAMFLLLSQSAATPEQVQKCVEVTNYTKERCEWELTR